VAFAPGAVLAGDFIGRGKPNWNTQASAVTLVINVALCLWWIPRAGILGAAWASSVAYALGAGIMLVRFQRVTGLRWREILTPQRADWRR
jgi:Na+-driven multidrug efflux pump